MCNLGILQKPTLTESRSATRIGRQQSAYSGLSGECDSRQRHQPHLDGESHDAHVPRTLRHATQKSQSRHAGHSVVSGTTVSTSVCAFNRREAGSTDRSSRAPAAGSPWSSVEESNPKPCVALVAMCIKFGRCPCKRAVDPRRPFLTAPFDTLPRRQQLLRRCIAHHGDEAQQRITPE